VSNEALKTLKGLFKDHPDAFKVFNLESLEKDYLKGKLKTDAFASRINLYVTGRTGAGKTSLGNSLLDSQVMKSTGLQDCTDFIGFFKLAGNLAYFDLPGIGSNINYENLNRVALLMDQRSGNKFSNPPVNPLKPSDELLIKDFSKCINPNIPPEEESITVEHWQYDVQQADIAPDVILYVLAPDKQFTDDDRQYLGNLLETWKERTERCIIIPVLNIFSKEDGTVLPTSNEIEYSCREISDLYQVVYPNEELPQIVPIVKINSKTGKGIAKITELICKILPQEKIGNLGQVLHKDLKKYAQQERRGRYYRTLSLIASIMARYTVDKKVGGQSLLQTATSAIEAYGIRTFKSAEAVSEVNPEMDSVASKVENIVKDKTEEITEKEDIIKPKEITENVPIYGNVTTTKQVVVKKPKVVKKKGWVFSKEEIVMEEEVVTLTNTQRDIIDYKKEVIGMVDEVIGQSEKFVGHKYQPGGYPAIKLLLGLGEGIQFYCDNQQKNSQSWLACLEQGELMVERKLSPYKSQIEQLVNADDGEQKLIQVLEQALLKNQSKSR